MYPPSSMGFYDVYGKVWEWTEDHFNGLPGFKSSYLYDDYSTPSFDGKHNMIMVIAGQSYTAKILLRFDKPPFDS